MGLFSSDQSSLSSNGSWHGVLNIMKPGSGSDQTPAPLVQSSAQHIFQRAAEMDVLCKVLVMALVVVIFQRMISTSKRAKLFPVWAAIEVALTGFIINGGGFSRRILTSIRRYGGSLYGLSPWHQVLVNYSGVDRLMSQPLHTINAEPAQYTLLVRVFGGKNSPGLKSKLENSWKDLLGPIEKMFLNDGAAAAAIERAAVPKKASFFVTFSSEPSKMERWELSAGVELITSDLSKCPGVVEANLQSLSRDFGACFAIPLLYGHDYFERNSRFLEDSWKFGNDIFPLLMIGIPPWAPFRIMKEGIAARSRLIRSLQELYQRIEQQQKNQTIESNTDMSDVSFVAHERNQIYDRKGWSIEERGQGDFAILWGQNANTHPVFFWFLTYVYSTPGVVARLREELAPYVTLSDTTPAIIDSMDFSAIYHYTPLLKASIFETYRMCNEPTSIRRISRAITIDDGEQKHSLKPGMFVSAPHALISYDPHIYPEPKKFIPDRFLERDAESGKLAARCGRLKPWGAGAAMCKGRSFAEKEIMALGAAIISLWDIGPASGTWKLPAMMPGTGVKKPVTDIRVRISRRAST